LVKVHGSEAGVPPRPGVTDQLDELVDRSRAVAQVHLPGVDIDALDGALVVVGSAMELAGTWPHDVLGMGQPERHEQQRRLEDQEGLPPTRRTHGRAMVVGSATTPA
jgi:hypothetical protein